MRSATGQPVAARVLPAACETLSGPGILPLRGTGLVLTRGGRNILDGVDISFTRPGISVLMGPNGAGKSVLMRTLAALVTPDRGTVSWGGAQPGRALRPRLGFVFQKPVLLRRSALANVRYGLRAAGAGRRESLERARHALDFVGLAALERSPARLLSGGEQQRLAMARALALEPEVLLLDEPTTNLDPASMARIESIIGEVSQAGQKVVLVTHDLGQARRLASDVAFLHRGRLLEHTPATHFFEDPASNAARAFLAGGILI